MILNPCAESAADEPTASAPPRIVVTSVHLTALPIYLRAILDPNATFVAARNRDGTNQGLQLPGWICVRPPVARLTCASLPKEDASHQPCMR